MNQKYFKKYGCEVIEIEQRINAGEIDFLGRAIPNKPPGYNSLQLIKHPASLVAELTYGCMFQTIYQGVRFDSCFNREQPNVNGFHDYEAVNSIVKRFSMPEDKAGWQTQFIHEHFELLKEDNHLKQLFDINIDDLILSEENPLKIDPQELQNRFWSFLANHSDIYLAYVKKLETSYQGLLDRGYASLIR